MDESTFECTAAVAADELHRPQDDLPIAGFVRALVDGGYARGQVGLAQTTARLRSAKTSGQVVDVFDYERAHSDRRTVQLVESILLAAG